MGKNEYQFLMTWNFWGHQTENEILIGLIFQVCHRFSLHNFHVCLKLPKVHSNNNKNTCQIGL